APSPWRSRHSPCAPSRGPRSSEEVSAGGARPEDPVGPLRADEALQLAAVLEPPKFHEAVHDSVPKLDLRERESAAQSSEACTVRAAHAALFVVDAAAIEQPLREKAVGTEPSRIHDGPHYPDAGRDISSSSRSRLSVQPW